MAKKPKKVVEVESTELKKIRFYCPTRGWIEQEIEVKRYKSENKEDSKYTYSFIEEEIKKEE